MKRKRTSSPQPPGPALAVRLIVHLLNHILSYVPSPRGVHERYLFGPEGSYVHDSGIPCPFYAMLSVQPTTGVQLSCWQYFTSKNFDRLARQVVKGDYDDYISLPTIISLIKMDYCDTISLDPALLTPFFRENASKIIVLAIVRGRHAEDLVYRMKDTWPGTYNWFFEPRFLGRLFKVWMTENIRPNNTETKRFAEMAAVNFFRRRLYLLGDFQIIQFMKDYNKFASAIVAEITSVATWVYTPAIYNPYLVKGGIVKSVPTKYFGRALRVLMDEKIKRLMYIHGLSRSLSVNMS